MHLKITFALLSILTLTNINDEGANKIIGTWLTQESDSKIEIYKGKDNQFYGKITWLKTPLKNGAVRKDDNNPDEDQKNREIMGLTILKNFTYDADEEEWNGGTIYDPKSGNTYNCYMWFEENKDILMVKGYIGFSLIGRKVSWTRID